VTNCKKILKDLYDIFPAPSAEKMFEILNHITPDLILLDVEMPVTNGYEAIKILKDNDTYKDIPVIFLSAMDDSQSEIEGLNLGAVDYIHKPFVSSLLIKRIEAHIAVIDNKKELLTLNKTIKELLASHSNDPEIQTKTEEEALQVLLSKENLLSETRNKMHTPLRKVISLIEASVKSNDINEVRHYLSKADIEARFILELLGDVLDMPTV
jgi:putative two-component system response regulator